MLGLGRDNLHSSLVVWLKIVLPLTALAFLSTLFLVSRGVSPEDAIPYADVDVADRLREPRLVDATFAGMTEDGAALTLKAAEAKPGTTAGAAGSASGLSGLLETPDGARTEISAAKAHLDQSARQFLLSGGVTLASSTGYRIETPGLSVALDRTSLASAGAVQATGPAGNLSAGAMLLTKTAAGYVLVFNGGVKLIYQPPG